MALTFEQQKQKRITIAQSVNIAKDLAIAKYGDKVTVQDVANLVGSVYKSLFKEVATKVYRETEESAEEGDPGRQLSLADLIEGYKKTENRVSFRNKNLYSLSKLSKEDRITFEMGLSYGFDSKFCK